MILVLNHLWQSTVFAAVVTLLTLSLTQHHARVRHGLWLAASVKFLVPFSLFVALGSHWKLPRTGIMAQPRVSVLMEEANEPFTIAAVPSPISHGRSLNVVPLLLVAVWAAGSVVVGFFWYLGWRRIRRIVRRASPIGSKAGVKILSSPSQLEPGVFGILRPVLVLPEGITKRLDSSQFQAILAHEVCHVRRRDNLAAAMHTLVEAAFWFHPVVWWIGARLVEERERACDEAVLQSGSEPQVYAEGILKVCEYYVESPLLCAAGVTGSNLKRRIEQIMTRRIAHRLNFGKKLMLASAGILAVATPVVLGIVNGSTGRAESAVAGAAFEVASIRPHKAEDSRMNVRVEPTGLFVANNISVKLLLQQAYHVEESQIAGAPSWISSERYDIQAKPADSVREEMRNLSPDERNARSMAMLQALLADRFKLRLHHETRELPAYALVVAKSGPKFHETSASSDDAQRGRPPKGSLSMGPGELTVNGASLEMFVVVLSRQVGRFVVDNTGLKGKYEFTLKWARDENAGEGAAPETQGASIFSALQEQLGLKLEAQRAPVDVLVIDRMERANEN